MNNTKNKIKYMIPLSVVAYIPVELNEAPSSVQVVDGSPIVAKSDEDNQDWLSSAITDLLQSTQLQDVVSELLATLIDGKCLEIVEKKEMSIWFGTVDFREIK